jgi:hypothetical protein
VKKKRLEDWKKKNVNANWMNSSECNKNVNKKLKQSYANNKRKRRDC